MSNIVRFLRSHPWIILTIASAVIIIGAARMHELWGDEAETALFARNILKYGMPKGWDGTNIMGINNGVVLDNNLINHTSPWSQYYLVAASFALFGQSSFSARLPFIILYILSIPLLYYVALHVTGKRGVATLATVVATFSVQGILFGYQARYYELTNVAGLLFLISAFKLLTTKRWPKILFVVSGIVFFYTNYVSWVAFYFAVLAGMIGYLLYTRQGKSAIRTFVMRYIILSIPIIAVSAPWYLIMQPFGNRGYIKFFSLGETINSWYQYTSLAFFTFHNAGVFPIAMAVATGLTALVRIVRKKTLACYILLLIIALLYVLIMALFTTVAWVDTVFAQARYTTVMLPIFYLAVALVIADILDWNKWLGIVVILVYLTTNFLVYPPRFLMKYFLHELTHPYQTPEILVANYLKSHAHKGDTAFVNFDRDHEPLIFFLGDEIRFVNRVSLVNTRIFPKNRDIIPRYIYDFRGEPDWLIFYSQRAPDGTFYTSDYRQLWPEVDLPNDYVEHVIPVFFSDLSRPEILIRSFYGIPNPTPIDYVYLYEKKQ